MNGALGPAVAGRGRSMSDRGLRSRMLGACGVVLMLGVPWVTMDSTANILANGVLAGTAFVLFRIFDILKLPPANRIQNLKGGSGILLDDIVAGVQAWAVLKLLLLWKSPTEVVECLGLAT